MVPMRVKQKHLPLDLLFRALADRTRLRLLNLVSDNEICVCYFVQILGLSQPKISRHLAYLRRAGLVAARRQGRWMHYRFLPPRDPLAATILRETLARLREQPALQEDLSKLQNACCSPRIQKELRNAPRPAVVAASAT